MNWGQNTKDKLIVHIFSSLAIVLLVFLLSVASTLDNAEAYFYSLLVQGRNVDPRILILKNDVTGDAKLIEENLAKTLNALNEKPPLAVGVLSTFINKSEPDGRGSLSLAKSFSSSQFPIVLPVNSYSSLEATKSGTYITSALELPPTVFTSIGNIYLGHSRIVDSSLGTTSAQMVPMTLRRRPKFALDILGQSEFYDAFGRALLNAGKLKELGTNSNEPARRIVFAGGPESIPTIHMSEILDHKKDVMERASGKILIVDADYKSEYSKVNFFSTTYLMSSAEVQGHVVNMLLGGYHEAKLSFWPLLLRLLIAGFIPLFFFYVFRKLWLCLSISVGMGFVYALMARYAFAKDLPFPILQIELTLLLSTIIFVIINSWIKSVAVAETDEQI